MKILMVENKAVRTFTFIITTIWILVVLGVCGAYILSSPEPSLLVLLAHLVFWSLLLGGFGSLLYAINQSIGNSLKRSFERKRKQL